MGLIVFYVSPADLMIFCVISVLCFYLCARREGVVGLYKGMTPYLVHVMPNICLVFLIYETIANR
jgi:Mitochondrial carrier protein